MQLEVYSSKEQAVRGIYMESLSLTHDDSLWIVEVTLVPSSDWHKDNPGEKSLIGRYMRTHGFFSSLSLMLDLYRMLNTILFL